MPENNILLFILAFLPSLLYAIVIYFSYPKKTINLKLALLHFLMGALSTSGVMIFHWIFPTWGEISNYAISFAGAIFLRAFVEVAVLEETLKLFFYNLTEIYRRKIAQPLSTMFYAMCISSGFAVVENIHYVSNMGETAGWLRATTAIVVHMVLGLMLGYFVSMGTRFKKKWLFRISGLLFVIIYHGIYDYNIMIAHKFSPFLRSHIETGLGIPNVYVILSGLLIVFIMFLHLRWLKHKKLF